MNCFRVNGQLDRKFLRVSAVYRLLKNGTITTKERAVELLDQRRVEKSRATVEVWLGGPLKHLNIKRPSTDGGSNE